ncbi:MAG: RloB domain-containing protein [Spirochaetaceae bacterium]|nr:RloB domain-containing protein [Spirochaetaceae bacterium]
MARKRTSIAPKNTMLIVTASEEEALYFSQLRKDSRFANLSVAWIGDNYTDINKCLSKASSERTQGSYSEVWFVFSFVKFGITNESFKEIQALANKKRVKLAWSNPGINLWYYFHFFSLNNPSISSEEIDEKIRLKISDYNSSTDYLKTDGLDFYKKICVFDNEANRNARMYNNIVEQFTGIPAINYVALSLAITENCGVANFTLNQRTIGMDK